MVRLNKNTEEVQQDDKPVASLENQLKTEEVQQDDKPVADENLNGYFIVKGKSVTSKKGILGPDQKVESGFFQGGQKTLDALVKSGHVVKL